LGQTGIGPHAEKPSGWGKS
jgi:hypothetical protein